MNKGGFTPLHYAAREGCAACVQNLLAAGADPDSEDPDRETPLLLALENMHFDTAAVLIQGGADLDKWDLFGRSPVYMAADVSTLPMKGNGAVAVLPSPDKLTALDVGRMMLGTRRESEHSVEAASAVSRRSAGSRRRHHARPGRHAAVACGARRR